VQFRCGANVAYLHQADLTRCLRSVRFRGLSGPAKQFGRLPLMTPLRTCAVFVPALGSRKDHPTATLRVCFHALQLTKRIERANRNQFEAHEVGLSQR
jgi:hypothetical protein